MDLTTRSLSVTAAEIIVGETGAKVGIVFLNPATRMWTSRGKWRGLDIEATRRATFDEAVTAFADMAHSLEMCSQGLG